MTPVKSNVFEDGLLRQATLNDVPAMERLVQSAYEKYVPRIGRKPKPMLANYALAVTNHQTWVVNHGEALLAILELIPASDYLLIENIAVLPSRQKSGYGRELMLFAEAEAQRQEFRELRLYTNEKFTENIRFYTGIGYVETHRVPYLGSQVVHMAKQL